MKPTFLWKLLLPGKPNQRHFGPLSVNGPFTASVYIGLATHFLAPVGLRMAIFGWKMSAPDVCLAQKTNISKDVSIPWSFWPKNRGSLFAVENGHSKAIGIHSLGMAEKPFQREGEPAPLISTRSKLLERAFAHAHHFGYKWRQSEWNSCELLHPFSLYVNLSLNLHYLQEA